jgi:hypothetical protein
MKAHLWESYVCGDSAKDEFVEVVGIHSLSSKSREYQSGTVVGSGPEAVQQFHNCIWSCDAAVRFPRLRRTNPPFPFVDTVRCLCL